MEGDRLILIPHDIGRPVRVALQRTFPDGNYEIRYLTERYISEDGVDAVLEDIRLSIKDMADEMIGREVYLIVGGAYLPVVVAMRWLVAEGIKFMILSFNRKLKRYEIFDEFGNRVGEEW